MALDLMQSVRHEVEGLVLDLLEGGPPAKPPPSKPTMAHVRQRAPLTHELAETMPRWARSLAPVAEKVAHMLGHTMEERYVPATPLTSERTRAAQAIVKARMGRGARPGDEGRA